MHRTILNTLILLLSLVPLGHQAAAQTFESYPARVTQIKPKTPNLKTHKEARLFRTQLRNAVGKGVNFAGNHVLARWGCGASCSVGSVIDGRSGRVYFPEELSGFSGSLEFVPDSRLLILEGKIGNDLLSYSGENGKHYLLWTGTRFKRVKFIADPERQ